MSTGIRQELPEVSGQLSLSGVCPRDSHEKRVSRPGPLTLFNVLLFARVPWKCSFEQHD